MIAAYYRGFNDWCPRCGCDEHVVLGIRHAYYLHLECQRCHFRWHRITEPRSDDEKGAV